MIDSNDDLEKYENVTYSTVIRDIYTKSLPDLKVVAEFKGGLSIDKIQNHFQKISGNLPQYPTYKIYSGILSKKYPFDPRYIEESDPKDTEDQTRYRTHLSLVELIKLYHADALTIGKNIFLSPDKMDLSSDRGKALLVHEMTHVVQQERGPQSGNVGETITSSKYLEMEKEAQDVERDFLRLSMYRKANKRKKSGYDADDYRNFRIIERFGSDNETDSAITAADDLSLVHPNIGKIFKRITKEEFSSLINQKPQTIFNNTNDVISLSNSADKSSSANKFANEPVFLASEDRSVYPPASSPINDLSTNMVTQSSNMTKESVDLNSLADQVYELMSRRLVMERSRRGMS
jgi:Domain of unknown function (DUF4157)